MQTSENQALADSIPPSGYLRVSQIVRILPLSRSTVWRKVRAGTFPRPVKLSDNVTAWPVTDLRAWIEARRTAAGR